MAEPLIRLQTRRRDPTPDEVDAFVKRLGKWLADVAAKPKGDGR